MSWIYYICGPTRSGKSTFALSGVKEGRSVHYHELDTGSYRRANIGLGDLEKNITLYKYFTPSDALTGEGKLVVTGRGNPMPQLLYDLDGWIETWDQFRKNYVAGFKEEGYVVLDTESMLWLIVRNAVTELMQTVTDKDVLGRLKFSEPNNRMLSVVKYAKDKDVDLVMTAHEKEQWVGNEPTGLLIPDGWSHMSDEADIVLNFKVENKKPVATVSKSAAAGLEVVGMKIVEPTMQIMSEFIVAARGLKEEEIPVPDSYDKLISTAKAAKII